MDQQTVNFEAATRGRRIANWLIDQMTILFVLFIALIVLALTIGGESLDRLEKIPDFVFVLAVGLPYYFLMEAAFGRTVGKLFLRGRTSWLQMAPNRQVDRYCCAPYPDWFHSSSFGSLTRSVAVSMTLSQV